MIKDWTDWFDGAQHVLFVHAHPDDESISTGGTIAGLNRLGRRASILTLTRGEEGEVMTGIALPESQDALVELRLGELRDALVHLGATDESQHAFLGEGTARIASAPERRYRDSGMQWDDRGVAVASDSVGDAALTRADFGHALADALCFVVATSQHNPIDTIVSYNDRGGYGHPDHVFAHHLARALSDELGIAFWVVSDATDEAAAEHNVEPWLNDKTAALKAHASQIMVRGDVFELTGGQVHPIAAREFFARAGH